MRKVSQAVLVASVLLPLAQGCKSGPTETGQGGGTAPQPAPLVSSEPQEVSTSAVVRVHSPKGDYLQAQPIANLGEKLVWKVGDPSVSKFYVYFERDGVCKGADGRLNGFEGSKDAPASCVLAQKPTQPLHYMISPRALPPEPAAAGGHTCNPGCVVLNPPPSGGPTPH